LQNQAKTNQFPFYLLKLTKPRFIKGVARRDASVIRRGDDVEVERRVLRRITTRFDVRVVKPKRIVQSTVYISGATRLHERYTVVPTAPFFPPLFANSLLTPSSSMDFAVVRLEWSDPMGFERNEGSLF
jgi:hypothetical protein